MSASGLGAARAARRRRSRSRSRCSAGYMAKVYGGRQGAGRPRVPPGRAARSTGSAGSIPDQEQRWTVYAFSVLAFSVVGVILLYAMQRLQTVAAVQPDERAAGRRGALVQHRDELRHEHELAELLPGVDAQPLHADGGLDGAELRLRRGRHGGDGRADPWARPAPGRHDRQLLGRPHAHDAAHPAPDRVRGRVHLRRHRRVQNFHGFEVVKTLEGNTQVIPGGPAASQEVIKMLGTNGGGFFNVNSRAPALEPERVLRPVRDLPHPR